MNAATQAKADPAAESGVDAHAITASISLHEMRPRMLKRDDTFAVLDRNGDALPAAGGPEGLYHRDTRHLSLLELRLAGVKPLLLSSAVSDDGAARPRGEQSYIPPQLVLAVAPPSGFFCRPFRTGRLCEVAPSATKRYRANQGRQ